VRQDSCRCQTAAARTVHDVAEQAVEAVPPIVRFDMRQTVLKSWNYAATPDRDHPESCDHCSADSALVEVAKMGHLFHSVSTNCLSHFPLLPSEASVEVYSHLASQQASFHPAFA
jgi:hypothetical protein